MEAEPHNLGDTKRRVLIIDANDLVARAISRILELAGCLVRSVQDTGSAVGVALAFQPHVLIVDVGTRRYDVPTLLNALRAHPQLQDCDFIGTTSSASEHPAPQPALRRVLSKPFTVAELYEAVLGENALVTTTAYSGRTVRADDAGSARRTGRFD